MAQFLHVLPNGARLTVVDIGSAVEFLSRLVAAFRSGTQLEPMIIGDENRPHAVVLPVAEWERLLAIADDMEIDRQYTDQGRRSGVDPRDTETYEEFRQKVVEALGGPEVVAEPAAPDREPLQVLPLETAEEFLPRLVSNFNRGSDKPVAIGHDENPEAVVVPISQWFDLLDIADEAAADQHLYDTVREALADDRPPVSYEDFMRTIYDPRTDQQYGEPRDS